jgi:hypothetical protein
MTYSYRNREPEAGLPGKRSRRDLFATVGVLIFSLFVVSFVKADYYVSPFGDDTADGLSQQSAWKTVSLVNDLDAGDRVFFEGGETCVAQE